VALIYPDDVSLLIVVLVASPVRLFTLDILYPLEVDPAEVMNHGEVVAWEDDAATIRQENQRFVDIALDVLAGADGGATGDEGNAVTDADAAEYGTIVDSLVGCSCERTLATNSIKLRFPGEGQRDRAYIWIDPPWALVVGEEEVATSARYDDAHFQEWSALFQPLDSTVLESWRADERRGTVFTFKTGHKLLVPLVAGPPEGDAWNVHWYATLPVSG
jgi:hypothetical protein